MADAEFQISTREAFLPGEHHRNKAHLRRVKLFKHRIECYHGRRTRLAALAVGRALPIIILLALFWHS